mgnify:CR=1 FL=1
MGTMNFSIPDDLKARFNEVFKDENKSAVISRLIREEIERRQLMTQRRKANDALDAIRASAPPIDQAEIRKLRQGLRK